MVHGEVSRFGEDLTSTARQTVVPDQEQERVRVQMQLQSPRNRPGLHPLPWAGLYCVLPLWPFGRLSGRSVSVPQPPALPLLPLGFGWVPRLARPLAVV